MELKGSKTEKNLRAAFAGECQARVKYNYFASVAKKEGYEEIANNFNFVSDNEKEHAKLWIKYLNELGSTEQNLQSAIDGEDYEKRIMYKKFARIAREEGFNEIADRFENVGEIENNHKKDFKKRLDMVKEKKVYIRGKVTKWLCLNCGHIISDTQAPKICPTCSHPQGYFAEI